jgi:hypothetical protein
MSIVDSAVSKIIGMVPAELIASEAPDSPGITMTYDLLDTVERMEPRIEEVLVQGEDVLGTYRPMKSPGMITLYWDKIGSVFWRGVVEMRRAGLPVEHRDLKRLATVAVYKTYSHERFHFFCDVTRRLFGGQIDHLDEEALAVAASYHAIEGARSQWNSSAGLLGEAPYRFFVQRIFAYTAPGYRDWVSFQTKAAFEDGLAHYVVPPPTRDFLTTSGVDLPPVLLSMQRSLQNGAVVERLVP